MSAELPYAPRRKRPLSPWNPLDYLVLLYWAFYFPQAIRWYVERFGSLPWRTNGWVAIRRDPVQRRLAVQAVGGLAIALGVVWLVASGLDISLSWGFVAFLVAFGVAVGAAGGAAVGVAYGVSAILALCRIDTFALALFPAWSPRSRHIAIAIQRVSPLPVSGLANELQGRLTQDWLGGLDECEGLLRYTLQSVPVVEAANRALASTEAAILLSRIAQWCERDIRDWDVLRFQSASLSAELRSTFWEGVWIAPARWRPKVDVSLRTDTPARAACAGFWLLHESEPAHAAESFEQVRHLPFGEEMRVNSAALATALDCEQFEQIAVWLPPTLPGSELLRPAVAQCLSRLGETARDAHLVLHSRSPRERSSALNRIIGNLKALQSNPSQCPQPERVVLVRIVDRWMDLAQRVAADVGTLEVRERVASPYIVGAPVPADRLVGRESVFDEIRSVWAKPGQRDSLLVYGHRRMGKTSVMRHVLEQGRLGSDTGLAYLTLQLIDPSMPLADLCQAIASALRRAAGRADSGIAPLLRSRSSRDWEDIRRGCEKSRDPVGWADAGGPTSSRLRGRRRWASFLSPTYAEDASVATRTGTRTTSGRAIRHRRQERAAPLANDAPPGVGTSYERRSLGAQTSPIAALRDFFERLHAADQTRRYILVLDEYELLDQYLSPAQASAFVALLRGLTQQYPWLAVALVGLHRLQERSASLYEPIYAWRSVRVSFLDANGVADVLQVDTDDFPLAFSPECLASIHRLTAGQPFLVQLLGDRLVERFNRRLREEIHPPSPTFSAEDVEAIVAAPSLYTQGAGYFRGIWAQAGEGPAGQQALLRALAPDSAGLALSELAHGSGLAGAGLDEALQSLIDHDVVSSADGRYRFTVELMRRWVAGDWMERDAAGA